MATVRQEKSILKIYPDGGGSVIHLSRNGEDLVVEEFPITPKPAKGNTDESSKGQKGNKGGKGFDPIGAIFGDTDEPDGE